MSRYLSAAGAILLVSLTACSGGGVSQPTEPGSSRPPFVTTTPGSITTPGTPAAVPAPRWDAIVADLAQRDVTGVPEVVSAQRVSWQNGALGCPERGMSYTQAIVDGMQVIVSVSGTMYDYRFGTGDTPRLCER